MSKTGRTFTVPDDFAYFLSDDFVVAVRFDAHAIEFAESRIREWFTYVKEKLREAEEGRRKEASEE